MNELSTCKGKYAPDEPIRILLRQEVNADRAEWHVTHLEKEILSGSIPVTEAEQALILPALNTGGYGIEIHLYHEDTFLTILNTAVNVDGDTVRYGFLCDFQEKDSDAVAILARYHITHVQFYDWSWRHHCLIAPQDEFQDMMGKHNSLPVIRQRIKDCHQRGMLTMAYGAVYAADRAYRDAHPDWGLYGAAGQPLVFINTFYYMDIDSPWRDHLIQEYKKAITRVGFDGIHMDTYGEPKTAFAQNGEKRLLKNGLPALINDTYADLRKSGIPPHLIFNNVGTWPAKATKDSPQDAVYMELWPPMDRYRHIRTAIQKAGKHPAVLAAYPAAFRTDEPDRALYSQLLLSFAIAMQGGTQLFIGEKNAVVTQGYYADYTKLTDKQILCIRTYEDFFVRYGDIFYDRSLDDVTYTHFGGDNIEYRLDSPCSPDGDPDRIWITIRENEQRKIIAMVNLCGIYDDHWNTGKNRPAPQQDVTLHILVEKEPEAVWYATPDRDSGNPIQLRHTILTHQYGLEVVCTIPYLFFSGLIWISSAS